MSPSCRVGMTPSYRCRSEPQMAVKLTLMIASCGLMISGSGTRVTSTLFLPPQHTARMLCRQLALQSATSFLDLCCQLIELFRRTIFLGELEEFSFFLKNMLIGVFDQRQNFIVEPFVISAHPGNL